MNKGTNYVHWSFIRSINKLFALTAISVVSFANVYAGDDIECIYIDLAKGRIGDIKFQRPVNEIEKSIGSNRIARTTECLEDNCGFGLYVIDIKGHKIEMGSSWIRIMDPAFRIKGKLGIGSTYEEFKKEFGAGFRSPGEGGPEQCFNSRNTIFCIGYASEEDATKVQMISIAASHPEIPDM